jgi:hypothetical protein
MTDDLGSRPVPRPADDGERYGFKPAKRAGRRRRHAALALALVLWPLAIGLVVVVVRNGDQIAYALAITGASFALAVPYLGLTAWLHSRRRSAAPSPSSRGDGS